MPKYYLKKESPPKPEIEKRTTFKNEDAWWEYQMSLKRKYVPHPDFDSVEMQEAETSKADAGDLEYLIEGEGFGGVQIVGGRFKQEDKVIHESLTGDESEQFRSLSLDIRQKLLFDTFKTLNQSILNSENVKFFNQGSTGVVAVVDPKLNRFDVVNLGDSEVIRVRCSQDTAEAATVNMLHKPHGEEAARIRKIPKNNLRLGRLNGRLSVSRAFGDKGYDEYGLIDDPDVYSLENIVSGDEDVFLIVTSDGLKDGRLKKLEDSDISDIVSKNRNQSLGQLSKVLTHTAIDCQSEDNISMLTFKFPCKELYSIMILGVFDGHGGADISEYLRTNFMQVFRTKLKEYAEKNQDLDVGIAALSLDPPAKTFTPALDMASSSSSSSSANESVVAEKGEVKVKIKI